MYALEAYASSQRMVVYARPLVPLIRRTPSGEEGERRTPRRRMGSRRAPGVAYLKSHTMGDRDRVRAVPGR